jgi:hypothetical protein
MFPEVNVIGLIVTVWLPFPETVNVNGNPVVLSTMSDDNTVILEDRALLVITIELDPTIPLGDVPSVFGAVGNVIFVKPVTFIPFNATVKLFWLVPIEFEFQ